MLEIKNVGTVEETVQKQTVFTGRKINSINITEDVSALISYTDCSNNGDVQKSVTVPFDLFQKDLESCINKTIEDAEIREIEK